MGLIGPSAAGKSTLARAFWESGPAWVGKSRLDGADVFTWNREDLGPFVGYLPQDIELFEGTISQNIAQFGDVDAEQVVAAAKMAGVHEMILHLPDGYDTVIRGQRRRPFWWAAATSWVGACAMVILAWWCWTEPNSNLDDQGDAALAGASNNSNSARRDGVDYFSSHQRHRQCRQVVVMRDNYYHIVRSER